jgi:dTDP-4-dehydrorhamnose 3,5-epimerase-like enzyme
MRCNPFGSLKGSSIDRPYAARGNGREERMQFLPTELPDVIIVEPDVYPDDRGFFLETYHLRKYREGVFPVRWDDPDIGIKWPVNNPILSAKDGVASYLRDVHEQLPTFVPRAR